MHLEKVMWVHCCVVNIRRWLGMNQLRLQKKTIYSKIVKGHEIFIHGHGHKVEKISHSKICLIWQIWKHESRVHISFLREYIKLYYLLTAKGRAIAIPVDLDNQVHNLFVKSNNIVQKTAMSWRLSARNAARRDSMVTASRDYRNIIERLQVQ